MAITESSTFKTPFYAEKGGQSADKGFLHGNNDASFEVRDVQLQGDKYLHYGKMTNGVINVEDSVISKIDMNTRQAIMRAHTATHLLHSALQKVLGDHVEQAGSLVEPDNVRFDFTHFSALTKEEIDKVIRLVNDAILDDFTITANEMPIGEAKALGAAALFGEKYGDIVRVVSIGEGFSTELCGGTHLTNTAKVGAFNITAEFSIASGVRRIEATTGKVTLATLANAQDELSKLAAMVKATSSHDISNKFEQNLAAFRELKNKLDAAIRKESQGEAARMLTGSREIGGLRVIAAILEDTDVDIEKLRLIEGTLRNTDPTIVAVLAITKDDKITIAAGCGDEAIAKGIKAGDLIRDITKICGGSGGGRPEFAMGGGKDPSKLQEALQTVAKIVEAKLKL